MKGRKGKKESTTVKGEMEREREKESSTNVEGLENGEKRGLNEEKRDGSGEREEQLPRERPVAARVLRPKSRVPKSTIPSPYP